MKIGDTFVWCPKRGIEHLWILISDPSRNEGKCVLVNITESVHAKHSFVLFPGQHRYIYKDSDVNFGDAFMTSEIELKMHIKTGQATPHDPLNLVILNKIIRLAHSHPAFQPVLRKWIPRI